MRRARRWAPTSPADPRLRRTTARFLRYRTTGFARSCARHEHRACHAQARDLTRATIRTVRAVDTDGRGPSDVEGRVIRLRRELADHVATPRDDPAAWRTATRMSARSRQRVSGTGPSPSPRARARAGSRCTAMRWRRARPPRWVARARRPAGPRVGI